MDDEKKEEIEKDSDRFPTVRCWNCFKYYFLDYHPTKDPHRYDLQKCIHCGASNSDGFRD